MREWVEARSVVCPRCPVEENAKHAWEGGVGQKEGEGDTLRMVMITVIQQGQTTLLMINLSCLTYIPPACQSTISLREKASTHLIFVDGHYLQAE